MFCKRYPNTSRLNTRPDQSLQLALLSDMWEEHQDCEQKKHTPRAIAGNLRQMLRIGSHNSISSCKISPGW